MSWSNVFINKNQIQAESDKSILVKEPDSDWLMWVSRRVVRQGTHKANISIGFNSDFEYEAFRQGKNRNKLDSLIISGVDAAKRWGVE